MIYISIILLIALFAEIFLLRKGLKAGKKGEPSLRQNTTSFLTSSQNKRVQPSSPPFQSQPVDVPEEPPVTLAHTPNLIPFPDTPKSTTAYSDFKHELRQKEPSTVTRSQEQSMLDIIQEIRGKSVPVTESNEVEDTSSAHNDAEQLPSSSVSTGKGRGHSTASPPPKIVIPDKTSEEEVLDVESDDIEEIEEIEDVSPLPDVEEAEKVLSPEELIKTGIQLVRQGDLDEGIARLEQVTVTAPDKADAYFNLGIAYSLKDAIPQAIDAYQKAIQRDDTYGKAYFNLGTLHLKQKNVQEAIEKLEKAVQRLPEPMKALWNLYEAYRTSELFTKALSTLRKLIEHEPDDASLHNHLGICYVKLGDYSKAIKSWEKSILLGASSHLVYYNLGKTYELCGELTSAMKQYQYFLKLTADEAEWQELIPEVEDRLENLRLKSL